MPFLFYVSIFRRRVGTKSCARHGFVYEEMKHKLCYLAFVLMTLAFPVRVLAYDFSAVAPSGQTLFYKIINNSNNVKVSGGYSLTGDLVIPESVTYYGTTYSMTEIGDYAFHSCVGLTSVTIPNSVTTIGSNAFSSCSGLTTPNTYW